ncbi:uncharacterized protein SCHCODRAFT_02483173 [Schizophyllum commune H4-8]|nr:uncharacterized protein SCHCODRAFT_02483173 [Schizophyllum commune H4-8]KAI5900326.1 hypothetical protein SCHCODRAFT_02483173 [Schizophyllum commune H4-8]
MSAAFRREPNPPKPVLSVRSQVDRDLHPAVDTALRDLKKFSRRLHATFDAFSEELQVLDRVFYKGKNQHRSALFWRRVADIRKFSQRIAEYNAPQNVDSCRCSFFGPDVQANSKALKGAWSHVPDNKTMAFILDRFVAGINLLDKAHERLLNAYRAFILEMQSGFFIQLILTLAALASRLDVLVQDLADALRGSWASMYRLFSALNPSEAKKVQKPQAAGALDSDKQDLPPHPPSSTLPVVEELLGGGEDTGETIKRVEAKVPIEPSTGGSMINTPLFDTAKANRPDEAKPAFTIVDDDEDTITVADITAMPGPARKPFLVPLPYNQLTTLFQLEIIAIPPTAPPSRTAPATVHPSKQPGVAASSTKQPKKRPVEDAKAKEQAPKRKKKKDAIDDIFGF